ncbi:FecR family protein [Sphingobacterium lumbrici]|uniref:FecR family protein n=1 Tax=Sphingobacterium lumbrici TaxID=2559600 RepID=UPI001127BAEF|nr:FecR family protein [Sphingobacterium lumbrici]
MSKIENYKRLIRLFYSQKLDQEEIKLIYSLKDDPEFKSAWEEIWQEEELDDESISREIGPFEMYERIVDDERVRFTQGNDIRLIQSQRYPYTIVGVAASLLLCAFAAIWYWSSYSGNNVNSVNDVASNAKSLIVPGRDRATIILDDGERIDLDQLQEGTIIETDDFSIVKNAEGHISYLIKPLREHSSKLVYNTIVTPRGGGGQLELPDGTVVWLNASTTLRYPIFFNADQRQVELNGEAYFDVAKQEIGGKQVSFIVNTGKQRLEVLGTKFNINNYGESIVTTLIEGRVKLDYPNTKVSSKVLVPSDQVVFSEVEERCNQYQVDPFYITAWKNGNFAFDDASIYEIMADIGRWYNVDIKYHGDFKGVRFSGAISRYSDIDKLLKTIAITGGFNFELKEREVHIMK